MAYYTTADLLTSVRAKGMFPDASTGSLSSANLLIYATEELQGPISGLILSARERYYETYSDQNLTANQATYSVPSRAIGGVLSTVQYISNSSVYILATLDPNAPSTTITDAVPRGFYFQNNSIVLDPVPSTTTGTLRMRYFQRPSRLEQTSNCAQVASFDANALTVTVLSIPSTWTTGTIVDFVPKTLPYTPYGLDTSLAGVSGTTITLAALPTGLAVGDWVSISETTPIPEIPVEFFVVLVQATVCKALEALGANEALQLASGKLSAYCDAALKTITPREQLGHKKVLSSWRHW